MFIVLKMGDTFKECALKYGDFEHWTIRAMGTDDTKVKVVDVKKQNLPNLLNIKGIVITGSHDMVTDKEPFVEKSSVWLKEAAKNNIPIFGVCFGHQLLAQTFGGIVANHPKGPEIGTISVTLNKNAKNDALFKDLPKTFLAHATHTQSAIKLPSNAILLASNGYEPHHAFRIEDRVWGVQFHPEHNADIIKEYISAQKDELENPAAVLSEVRQTPHANSLLERFARFCENQALKIRE